MPRPPQVPHLGGSEGADPLRGQKKRNKEQSRNKRARRRGIVVDAYGDIAFALALDRAIPNEQMVKKTCSPHVTEGLPSP